MVESSRKSGNAEKADKAEKRKLKKAHSADHDVLVKPRVTFTQQALKMVVKMPNTIQKKNAITQNLRGYSGLSCRIFNDRENASALHKSLNFLPKTLSIVSEKKFKFIDQINAGSGTKELCVANN